MIKKINNLPYIPKWSWSKPSVKLYLCMAIKHERIRRWSNVWMTNPAYVKFKLSWVRMHSSVGPYEQHSKKTALLFMDIWFLLFSWEMSSCQWCFCVLPFQSLIQSDEVDRELVPLISALKYLLLYYYSRLLSSSLIHTILPTHKPTEYIKFKQIHFKNFLSRFLLFIQSLSHPLTH